MYHCNMYVIFFLLRLAYASTVPFAEIRILVELHLAVCMDIIILTYTIHIHVKKLKFLIIPSFLRRGEYYKLNITYIDFLVTFGSLRFGVYNKTHLRHPSQRLRKFTYVSWNLVPSFLCHADSTRYKILHKMNYFIVFLCSGICFLKALCLRLGTSSHPYSHNRTHNMHIATLK